MASASSAGRPRRHHRPPPDAPARRLLRQAAPVPARRLRHHRPGHRPRPHGARPWRGRFRAVQGARHRSGVRGRGRRQVPRPTGLWLGGQGSVINNKFNAPDGPICTDLREAGALLAASADFKHSYPHSWRSKAKVIYRCTPQWFIADGPAAAAISPRAAPSSAGRMRAARSTQAIAGHSPTLRQLALQAIADTRCVPEKGRNRIGSMVEGRPDWVISRQRAWGVPIALFVDRKTGELLVDPQVNQRIVAAITRAGRRRLVRRQRRRLPRQRPQPRRLRDGQRHSRRLVRQRLDPCLRARKRPLARRALARRPLSRRLGPASRLVPVVAARKLRHARPGAVRRGADPRLHDGRQGHENVQEPRQHRRPARPDARLWRRHPAAVGAVASTSPRTTGSARKSSPASPTSIASCATPSAICSARSTGSATTSGSTTSRACPSWSATCSTCSPSSTRSCARRSTTSTSTPTSAR